MKGKQTKVANVPKAALQDMCGTLIHAGFFPCISYNMHGIMWCAWLMSHDHYRFGDSCWVFLPMAVVLPHGNSAPFTQHPYSAWRHFSPLGRLSMLTSHQVLIFSAVQGPFTTAQHTQCNMVATQGPLLRSSHDSPKPCNLGQLACLVLTVWQGVKVQTALKATVCRLLIAGVHDLHFHGSIFKILEWCVKKYFFVGGYRKFNSLYNTIILVPFVSLPIYKGTINASYQSLGTTPCGIGTSPLLLVNKVSNIR